MKKKKNIQITCADREETQDLEMEIETVLEALGHEEAFVTDESELGDFFDIFLEYEEKGSAMEGIEKVLGIEITDEYEKIVDIAKRLRAKRDEHIQNNGE
jgi:hypothetical protein